MFLKHPFPTIMRIVQSAYRSSNSELPFVGYGITPQIAIAWVECSTE